LNQGLNKKKPNHLQINNIDTLPLPVILDTTYTTHFTLYHRISKSRRTSHARPISLDSLEGVQVTLQNFKTNKPTQNNNN